ncbi:MAG: 30S ribosomal protein S11 [Acidobacteria bacterium]|jgi:small subunit ribosomal protein S11|nr:30S ribosomal protein S11 [Acidobacteriota bacterium]
MAQRKSSSKTKKKERKVITHGVMFIHSTFNNTIITITDPDGKVLTWASGGMVGFKGSRKSTPFAAQLAAEKALKDAENFGLRSLDVRVKGPGAGRESAIRSIGSTPLQVRSIKDVTPIPHNGCRPPKKRRV